MIGGAVEKVGAITAGAVERVGAVTDGAVEKVGAITGGAVEKVGAVPDKIAGGEAVHDNTAGERVEETSVELAVLEAAERVDEEADEIIVEKIVINSIEAIIDKIAGGEAAYDNTAGERVDEEADEITIEEIVINSIRGV